MKLLPRTLFGQMLLALFAGLLAAYVLGAWLMFDERVRFGERLLGEYAAQRIAGVISILDQSEAGERVRLVRALNVPPTRLSLDEPWQAAAAERSAEAESFLDSVVRELERPLTLQVLSIRRAALPRPDAHGPGAGPMGSRLQRNPRGGRPLLFVVAQARLGDGAVVTFRHALPQQRTDWPLRALGLLLLTALSVALLSGWAVRRLTRPLSSLADAAAGLARNLDQPPLPESGPQEVVRAARAFNTMQRELKIYLQTRAQALAGVSHDLRLPITRIRLRLESLRDEKLKSKIEDDLAEMDAMIGGTLEYLRAGASSEETVRVDLNALVESVVEDMETLGAGIRLHGRSAAPLRARPQALRRCLANLLDNARRYGGGEVDVTIEDRGEAVEIRIEDRGPGISSTELERVFEPYVRLETSRARQTGGTGLGLAIARAIARAHGGEVRLAAREGGGLSAVLLLPRRQGS